MIGSKCSEKGLYGNGVTVNNMSTAGTFLNVFLAGTFFDDARRYYIFRRHSPVQCFASRTIHYASRVSILPVSTVVSKR